ncbi:PREDICTED: basic salivary proline-rich protein 3-like [Chrysochloris asiatica]|uniref:Basic salivary proline-rich protein 3-like n=1 Tax=Chrysochloris asiatica TaxID=185453 RepID=A0A9B0TQB9_CHRAS|nr:PREDICTED: basic salivary proline-rich protein 3-like [Chrysochloris asiatica]
MCSRVPRGTTTSGPSESLPTSACGRPGAKHLHLKLGAAAPTPPPELFSALDPPPSSTDTTAPPQPHPARPVPPLRPGLRGPHFPVGLQVIVTDGRPAGPLSPPGQALTSGQGDRRGTGRQDGRGPSLGVPDGGAAEGPTGGEARGPGTPWGAPSREEPRLPGSGPLTCARGRRLLALGAHRGVPPPPPAAGGSDPWFRGPVSGGGGDAGGLAGRSVRRRLRLPEFARSRTRPWVNGGAPRTEPHSSAVNAECGGKSRELRRRLRLRRQGPRVASWATRPEWRPAESPRFPEPRAPRKKQTARRERCPPPPFERVAVVSGHRRKLRPTSSALHPRKRLGTRRLQSSQASDARLPPPLSHNPPSAQNARGPALLILPAAQVHRGRAPRYACVSETGAPYPAHPGRRCRRACA